MPTTVTHTIKSAGGDYTSLSAWETAQQANLVTNDRIAQAECYAFALSDRVTINGWTTDATRYIRIYTPDAERHDGRSRDVSGTGFQITNTAANTVFTIFHHVRLEGLDIKQTGAENGIIPGTGGDIRVTECVLYSTSNSDSLYHINDANISGAVFTLRNLVLYGTIRGMRFSGLSTGT